MTSINHSNNLCLVTLRPLSQGSMDLLKHYNPEITDTINTLKSTIGKGLGVSGFAYAIGKVRSGLQGYESGLDAEIEVVKNAFKQLTESIKTAKSEFNKPISKPLTQQLSDASTGGKFITARANNVDEAVKKLDEHLKGMLTYNVKLLLQAVEGFHRVTEDVEVKHFARAMDTALVSQKQKLNGTVNIGITNLQKTLDVEIGKVGDRIKIMGQQKDAQLKLVTEAIDSAVYNVEDLLDAFTECRNDTKELFVRLRNETTEINPTRGDKSNLRLQFDQMAGAGTGIENDYTAKLLSVNGLVEAAVRRAVEFINNVDQSIKSDLIGLKTKTVKNAIEGFVLQLNEAKYEDAAKGIRGVAVSISNLGTLDGTEIRQWLTKTADGLQNVKSLSGQDASEPNQYGRRTLLYSLENLKTARHKNGGSEKSLFTVIGEDIVKEVDKAIGDIETTFSKIMSEYYQLTKKALTQKENGAFRNMINGIKEHVNYTFTHVDGKKVNTKLLGEYETNKSLYDAAKIAMNSIIPMLEKIPSAVDDAQLEADSKIQLLEQQLNLVMKSLKFIESVLRSAAERLHSAIDDIHEALSNASKKFKTAVSQLQSTLLATVSSAFSTLTHQVQSLFAKQKQAEFAALESVVTAQLQEIERVIQADRESGVKGFLSRLKGDVDASGSAVSPNKLDAMITVVGRANQTPKETLGRFAPLASVFKTYADDIFTYIEWQVKTPKKFDTPGQGTLLERNKQSKQVANIKSKIDQLLGHLINHDNKIYNYDTIFCAYLRELINAVGSLTADTFGEGRHPNLLNLLKDAMTHFDKELNYAYVSTYSDRTLFDDDPSKYAKVCLTTLPVLYTELTQLKEGIERTGENWRFYSMYNSSQPRAGLYGVFFRHNGYDVGRDRNIDRGELNNKATMNSNIILRHLATGDHVLFSPAFTQLDGAEGSLENESEPTFDVVHEEGVIPKLYAVIKPYNQISHLSTSFATKTPCSVYEQLIWLSGLQFNTAFGRLLNHVPELFMVPDELNPSRKVLQPINAHTKSVLPAHISDAIEHLSEHAYLLLAGILGTGDANTIYACDFGSNSHKLKYPTSGEECFDMLLDILRRLFTPLKFLMTQCGLSAKHNGWNDCTYGKGIATTNWPCNDHSRDKATCQPKCQANCQPNCRTTSPLMSYLNDCLPGHLPHTLETIGCKSKCLTCPSNKKGMPCITPFGFRAFSGSTRTGAELCDMIAKFLDNEYCTSLFCLAPTPPATLPEHFGFALSIAQNVNPATTVYSKIKTFAGAFESSIKTQSINLYEDPFALTKPIINAYGSDSVKHGECEYYHLRNLTSDSLCKHKANRIGSASFLSPLCSDSYDILANKHSKAYLSWVVYSPWTFWNYLNNLYNEFCNVVCQDWGCRQCMAGDACKRGKHGSEKYSCHCKSIVLCKGVSPTLYRCGFMFADASTLNTKDSVQTCFDFQMKLNKILNSQYFTDLFTECDNFLWTIRTPFSYLVLALWLLSLLYLIHIMVIRLDLLHIKSHLHSPSSHRIAAQSLLAAGRVNKLNRVFYLQP
ncbi:hypothetical protein BBBOND_0313980 [Babesia bigemina]|uniref:C3H1-type domain-containing protein n=1 Tax=Babesia bigemina TaxID=5866 RepID=A0A061D9W0_BABBI|nr:hypothetical protein BBBOND_0313980 [Babesia bigemina]CDR97496.1 hypothetical protein BBBOND_0313980 [Babesia bigemina]|eukprot:XP_012769682.1 hypothetical protein BBBOND_0313980 [Babesia bigemina]